MDATKIYGLVLSGGKSTRMGTDKGNIVYHELPQREHLYHLLNKICERTFLSVRSDQQADLPKDMDYILDKNEYRGPYNGLLSAHDAFPEATWLVLACDLPLMDYEGITELLESRDMSKIATAFATRESQLPEPLCALWEPEALRSSKAYLDAGNGTCPRKFLINSEVRLVHPNNELVLLNANSKEEYTLALDKLNSHE
ncbi:NTP transferase domain-containing protein [Spongiimicrobium salis]|uniref:NTP transferase domain-containing protein n=1 Tax=Spongiimicrobium salis TaxID=1667022 RepID=UPI00374D6407